MNTQAFRKRYGEWGLVAGAAEGLGEAFSEVLADWGINLIMVDVNGSKMGETATRISEQYGVRIKKMVADLSRLENLDKILLEMTKVDCRLFIYNAAYGPVKGFLDNAPEELDYYLDLNARMPIHLVHRFLKEVWNGKPAGMLIMSSLAGLWGTQLVVPYGATKAFDYNLAEGLHHELKGMDVDVMACCAGATDTPNYRSTLPRKHVLGPTVLKPRKVAEKALKNLGKKALYIPGFANQFNYFLLTKIFPRKFSAKLMNKVMFKMYRGKSA